MDAGKLPGKVLRPIVASEPAAPVVVRSAQKREPSQQLPSSRTYAQANAHASSGQRKAGTVLALHGFGDSVPVEFGSLPLDARTKIAQSVALDRSRRISKDYGSRLGGWRDDYGAHLTESKLAVEAEGAQFGDAKVRELKGWQVGRLTLGIYELDHPDGPRVIKLLPQTGFHDALVGNLLAEKMGGPKIHRFGTVEVTDGKDRLHNYRNAMFIEMEHVHPGTAVGAMKQIIHDGKETGEYLVPRDQVVEAIAQRTVDAMLAKIVPRDLDLLFDNQGNGRFIDGDFFVQVFDTEEVANAVRYAFNPGSWLEAPGIREEVREAVRRAIEARPMSDADRRRLRDAFLIF